MRWCHYGPTHSCGWQNIDRFGLWSEYVRFASSTVKDDIIFLGFWVPSFKNRSNKLNIWKLHLVCIILHPLHYRSYRPWRIKSNQVIHGITIAKLYLITFPVKCFSNCVFLVPVVMLHKCSVNRVEVFQFEMVGLHPEIDSGNHWLNINNQSVNAQLNYPSAHRVKSQNFSTIHNHALVPGVQLFRFYPSSVPHHKNFPIALFNVGF